MANLMESKTFKSIAKQAGDNVAKKFCKLAEKSIKAVTTPIECVEDLFRSDEFKNVFGPGMLEFFNPDYIVEEVKAYRQNCEGGMKSWHVNQAQDSISRISTHLENILFDLGIIKKVSKPRESTAVTYEEMVEYIVSKGKNVPSAKTDEDTAKLVKKLYRSLKTLEEFE